MDTRTGEIVTMHYVDLLKENKNPIANFYKEIPEQFLEPLKSMSRKERRKWYKKNKREFK